ncbi:hypothetical protein [Calothrix sp. NIES-2098]|uniref:hypothetical protein n=1 Tax=Calothrix sp. NIES-2098 TaxID=1954171 RepID=UPI000B601EFD|nr:hypothetical protein NIES2098_47290 [Calothrix sp. NIES-2098]
MNGYYPPAEHYGNLASLPNSEKEAHLKVKSYQLYGLSGRLHKLLSNQSSKGKSERQDEARIISTQIDILTKEILCLQNQR